MLIADKALPYSALPAYVGEGVLLPVFYSVGEGKSRVIEAYVPAICPDEEIARMRVQFAKQGIVRVDVIRVTAIPFGKSWLEFTDAP